MLRHNGLRYILASEILSVLASLLVWPGFSETVVVVIKPPKGLNLTGNPVLFGFLEIANADESYHVRVTYLGLAAALKGTHVDNTDTFFGVQIPAIFYLNSNVVNTTHNFTFQGTDFPSIVSRLDFGTGTPLFRFDLVQPVTTSLSSRDGVHVFERWAYTFLRDKKPNTLAKVQTIGSLSRLSATYQPRNSN